MIVKNNNNTNNNRITLSTLMKRVANTRNRLNSALIGAVIALTRSNRFDCQPFGHSATKKIIKRERCCVSRQFERITFVICVCFETRQ
jgi:hypothetical protein